MMSKPTLKFRLWWMKFRLKRYIQKSLRVRVMRFSGGWIIAFPKNMWYFGHNSDALPKGWR